MRALLRILALGIGLVGVVRAQPLRRGAIVLKVVAEQIVRFESQWQTSWGDFSKDYINSRVLVIDLRQARRLGCAAKQWHVIIDPRAVFSLRKPYAH